jgi:hypothetical protein
MTMINEMSPVTIKKPEPYIVDNLVETKICNLQLAQNVKAKGKFESEAKRLYAVIIGQCTEFMIAKLKSMPTFKDIHANKDALRLLRAIKGLVFRFDGEKNM